MNTLTALLFLTSGIAAQQVGDTCPLDVAECPADCSGSCVIEAIALNDEGGNEVAHYACGCDEEAPDSSVEDLQVGDACPVGGQAPVINECTADCTDSCVIKAIALNSPLPGDEGGSGVAQYVCGCEEDDSSSASEPSPSPDSSVSSPTPVPEPKCSPAYDDKDYCLCPGPNPSPSYPQKTEVSVCGDATYLLDNDVIPCSGPTSEAPAGTACPKKGDVATIACRDEILSYLTGGKTGTCKAPEDAVCEKLNTGAWGCVFPGNCNTVNTCLEQPVCTEEYETAEDGTCVVMDNGYVKPAENNTALYDTTALSELQQKIDESSSTRAILVSSIVALAVVVQLY